MTEVEEFILENPAKIMLALSTMQSDKELALSMLEGAKVIMAQIGEWKKERRDAGFL